MHGKNSILSIFYRPSKISQFIFSEELIIIKRSQLPPAQFAPWPSPLLESQWLVPFHGCIAEQDYRAKAQGSGTFSQDFISLFLLEGSKKTTKTLKQPQWDAKKNTKWQKLTTKRLHRTTTNGCKCERCCLKWRQTNVHFSQSCAVPLAF